MNSNNEARQRLLRGGGWPKAKVVIASPTNECSGFRKLLEAIARGEFAQVVEVEMTA